METNRDKLNRLCMESDVDTIMDFAESEVCDCCDRFCEKNLSPTQPSCEGRWCEEAISYWLEEHVKGESE